MQRLLLVLAAVATLAVLGFLRAPLRSATAEAPRADAEVADPSLHAPSPPPIERCELLAQATAVVPTTASEEPPDSSAENQAPPLAEAAPDARSVALARAISGAEDAALAREIRAWSLEHAEAARGALTAWNAAPRTAGTASAEACAAFDQRMEELAAKLEQRFGRSAALQLALAGGLYRADAARGEIIAVDLDGQPLPERLDPSL